VTIIDYWRILWRGRAVILAGVAIAMVIGLLVVSSQQKVYTARATMLAPREGAPHGLSGSLGALLGADRRDGGGGFMPALIDSGPSFSTTQDMFMAILQSRTSRAEVSAELVKKHGPEAPGKIVAVDVNLFQKGLVTIAVESTDPGLAAEAANLYPGVLDRVLERMADAAVRRQGKFYADQLQHAAKEVAAAEEAVLNFSAENRVVPIDTATRAAVDPTAQLRGHIMALELQREVQRMRMTDQHPQMRDLEKQISELKKQYSKNLFGAPMDLPGEAPGQRRKEFFVSTEKTTPVQFAYLKLYRNLKIQEAFHTGALQGIEQLKYGDGRQVRAEPLDPALPPGAHTRPRVLFTVLAATVGGLIISIIMVSMREYAWQLRVEERRIRARRAPSEHHETLPGDVLLEGEPFTAAGRSRQ
jgi:uncharacterized protein involved in exopolysaccharide biosynthesis